MTNQKTRATTGDKQSSTQENKAEKAAKPLGTLTTSAYLNSFKSLVPHARSTGLRTAQLRFNSISDGQTDIATDFLLNSSYRRGDREFDLSVQSYFDDAALAMVSRLDCRSRSLGTTTPLPEPLPLPMALHEIISKRRSQREMSGEALTLAGLATILQCAGGVTAQATVELESGQQCSMPLRATPSGGALYPIDIYLAAHNVSDLPRGLYRFLNDDNAVLSMPQVDADAVERLLGALPNTAMQVRQAAVCIVLVVRPWRSRRKYGARGLRFALLEAGYISENVHLASTALGAPSCDFGGFYDDEVNAVFGFDGTNEAAIHLIFVGG